MADITITEGDTLEVDYSVENTGDGTGDQDVRLLIESVLEDTDANVILDPGQTATGTLQWPTESGDAVTDALAEALTDDTGDSITVTIEEASAIPDSGVARYTFDDADTSGSTATDVWNANDATINGATTGVSGANQTYTTNEAYSFDGTDDNVQTPISDTFSTFSLSAWAKWDNTAVTEEVISTRSSQGAAIRQRDNGNIQPYAYDTDASSYTSVDTVTVSADTWYHVIFVIDSSELRVYVDGVLEGSEPFGTYGNGNDVRIGERADGGLNMTGNIDDPRIYDKPLTDTEASNLYNTGSIDG